MGIFDVLIGVLGAIIGALLGFLGSLYFHKKQERIRLAKEQKEAKLKTLDNLANKLDEYDNILDQEKDLSTRNYRRICHEWDDVIHAEAALRALPGIQKDNQVHKLSREATLLVKDKEYGLSQNLVELISKISELKGAVKKMRSQIVSS